MLILLVRCKNVMFQCDLPQNTGTFLPLLEEGSAII